MPSLPSRDDVRIQVLGWLARAAIAVITATTRWSVTMSPEVRAHLDSGKPSLFVLWHNRLMLIGRASFPGRPLAMVMSTHADSRILGVAYADSVTHPIFGSSRRNPVAALKGMIRMVRSGIDVALTPDGPRGPRMRCRSGVIETARLTGAPIVPVAWSVSRRKVARSWDRFVIALPFSRGVLLYGVPIRVPRDLDETGLERARLEVEDALTKLTAEADRLVGHEPMEPADPVAIESAGGMVAGDGGAER